ncbi:hypothetical protein OG439_29610 [Amycolatopsis sp. NBC_01307]|uniref:hypothetical protein n=1 Tax=Amycolatopsis sp. NBC_01307 TaxID=2903561 RepID=UPI002E14BDDB|nr:hypothetical protein OG439_29610 [Amycolatopsis sp. NBC_01307]
MTQVPVGVRPTKRCLADLGLSVPDLGHPLEELDNPVVAAAQAVPHQRDAGGARRILALCDRVWFKVKTADQRAVVTRLHDDDLPDGLPRDAGRWWIGAAGRRQADSPQRDFYESIKRECTDGKTVSTARLLPADWDWKRFTAEQAVAWRREMKKMVLRLISMSLTTGKLAVAEFRHHRVKALVRLDEDHEAYLAIIAEGIPDPAIFALLLDCVPGVTPDDWQPEPSPLAETESAPGEIIWSTLLRSEVASAILDLDTAR